MPHHPDDGRPGRGIAVANVLAHRTLTRPVLPRENLVDQRHGLRIGAVERGEHAALAEGNLERVKVVGADHRDIAMRTGIARRRGAAVDLE